MMRFFLFALLLLTSSAYAAGPAVDLPDYEFSFEGPLGTFDKQQLQRGFQVYKEVCASCHGIKRVAYRNLSFLGYNDNEIKAIARGYEVEDGPNEEGEMFMRPAIPADKYASPYPNEQAARAANGGAYPLDLSLITKARPDGVNYLKALLMGYEEPPEGKVVPDGMYYNAYFPGNLIAMPNPLGDGFVTYADGSPETVQQYSADVTAFLTWTAEPKLEERKQIGFKAMLFIAVMTLLFFLSMRAIWASVKKKS